MALSAVKNLMATGSRRVYKWMVALLHIISNNPAKVIAVMSTSLLLLQNMIRFFQPSMSVQPWYATNKEWHGPAKFPLCTMDVCFNFSRCDHTKELLVYHYNTIEPYWPANYFHALPSMPWYTTDPEKACLFFVFSDKDLPKGSLRPHPNTLPYWNGGLNHVIVTLADKWSLTNPPEGTIGKASILASRLHENSIRLGFDIPVPLPRLWHAPPELQSLKPFQRKYFATFKGTRYLNRAGAFRSNDAFLSMHNGKDVIVATTCNQVTNNNLRKRFPKKGVGCDRDQILFDKYAFEDLFNSTFGLAPGGRSPSTFRLLEILGAGSIPVLIVDNYVKPFDNFIEWQRCLLQFPSSEVHRVLSTLRALSKEEVETRQCYCQAVFEMFLKDDATLLNTVMLAFKARFYGSLANFPLNETYLPIPSN